MTLLPNPDVLRRLRFDGKPVGSHLVEDMSHPVVLIRESHWSGKGPDHVVDPLHVDIAALILVFIDVETCIVEPLDAARIEWHSSLVFPGQPSCPSDRARFGGLGSSPIGG